MIKIGDKIDGRYRIKVDLFNETIQAELVK